MFAFGRVALEEVVAMDGIDLILSFLSSSRNSTDLLNNSKYLAHTLQFMDFFPGENGNMVPTTHFHQMVP